jgi:hypothetical protein
MLARAVAAGILGAANDLPADAADPTPTGADLDT